MQNDSKDPEYVNEKFWQHSMVYMFLCYLLQMVALTGMKFDIIGKRCNTKWNSFNRNTVEWISFAGIFLKKLSTF